MPDSLSNIIEYFEQCYRSDNRELNIFDFLDRKIEDKFFIEGKEELVSNSLPIIPIDLEKAISILKKLEIFQKEKELVYASFFVCGSYMDNRGVLKRLCSPLFYYPASIEERDGFYYISIDSEDKRLNLPLINHLSEEDVESFQLALLLGIAYGATIGGMSTLIGTGPNGMLAAFMSDNYDLDISFVDWMKVGVPLSAVMLPSCWLILTRIAFKVNFETSVETRELLSTMKSELGELKGPELKVLVVFILTAMAWMFRTVLDDFSFLNGLSDAGIAMISALFLFLLPSGNKEKNGALLEWKDAQENVPWGLLVLFGGGLSLANAVQATGLAVWIGNLIPQGISLALIVILVVALIIFLTELTSNMATTATFLPVVAALAIQSNFNPLLVTAAVALAASCAFMLPVATPPNAIVFGSGLIRVPQMARAGFLVNVLGIIVVSFVAVVSVPYFLL